MKRHPTWLLCLKNKNCKFGHKRVCQKWLSMAKKSCLAWFYTYIRGCNRFLVPKNIGKDTQHGCIAPKQKYIILVAPHMPKMANYGQKSCLAWFEAYIRVFNRFLVPKSIENDTPHAHINQKYTFLDFYKVNRTKKMGVVKNGRGH